LRAERIGEEDKVMNGSGFRFSYAAVLVGALVAVVTIALVALVHASASIQVVA
jgi:hypothetical protein